MGIAALKFKSGDMEAMGKNLGGSVMLFLVPKIVETLITWAAKQGILQKSLENEPFRNPKNPGKATRMRRFDSDPRLQFLAVAAQELGKSAGSEFHRNLPLFERSFSTCSLL